MPTIVDSLQCHLWTDALHLRQLAREAKNQWDRGTYVRMCVTTSWTAIEVACQEALACPEIGHRFKKNLDKAIALALLPPIDWSKGIWQEVRALQELRKSYVHKFATLINLFPHASVAENAIKTARNAIETIFAHVGETPPSWTALDDAQGWQKSSNFGTANLSALHANVKMDDPLAVRVFMVINGEEKLNEVLPSGSDPSQVINKLLQNVLVPISGIRVYENGELKQDLVVKMRGNA